MKICDWECNVHVTFHICSIFCKLIFLDVRVNVRVYTARDVKIYLCICFDRLLCDILSVCQCVAIGCVGQMYITWWGQNVPAM